jgi:integrase
MNAERWLVRERDYKEKCAATGETWKPPKERATEKRAKVLTLSEYGKTVIAQRVLKPRTRIEYEAKWSQLIEPQLGSLAVRDLSPTAVRAWYSALDPRLATRNGHAYGVLSMICNTAVRDGLLDRNPCQIVGATNAKPKRKVRIASTVELHAIADKLGSQPSTAQLRAAVLLAAWCGLRFGEVSELRRKDLNKDCSVLTVTRAVTHRADPNAADAKAERCKIDSTKGNEDQRKVTIPPHIRADVVEHLANYVGTEPDSLLFKPVRGGCHLHDRVFNDTFKRAAKDIGRQDLSAHDLRRFAGSKNAQVATLTENMARLGHKTVEAALRYQHSESGRDAAVAAALSANALAELEAAGTEHEFSQND